MFELIAFVTVFLPFGLFVLKYVLFGIARQDSVRTLDASYCPTVTAILPCFNESAAVYDTIRSLRESDYPVERFKILVVDDASSDDSYKWILKAAEDFPNVEAQRNAHNLGKSRTILRALGQIDADIVMTVDSDMLFHRDAVKQLMLTLSDPTIDLAGGVVGVRNANQNLLTQMQALVYVMSFRMLKMSENWIGVVGCVAGCLFAIRRETMMKIKPMLDRRHWFGLAISDGEDRFLTHQVVLNGSKTEINLNSLCWTTVPTTLSGYFKQQLRWRRSGVRDLFYTMKRLHSHTRPSLSYLYVFLFNPVTTLTAMLGAIYILLNPLSWLSVVSLMMYIGAAFYLNLMAKKHDPSQAVENTFWVGLLGFAWSLVNLLLTIICLFSFHESSWGTRTKILGGSHG